MCVSFHFEQLKLFNKQDTFSDVTNVCFIDDLKDFFLMLFKRFLIENYFYEMKFLILGKNVDPFQTNVKLENLVILILIFNRQVKNTFYQKKKRK